MFLKPFFKDYYTQKGRLWIEILCCLVRTCAHGQVFLLELQCQERQNGEFYEERYFPHDANFKGFAVHEDCRCHFQSY